MSEPTDAQIAEEEDKALDAQIADYEEQKRHHYTIDRKLWIDRKGNTHMSDHWQIRCSCGWRGTRVQRPSREESKKRVAEWEAHVETV